MYLDSGSPSFLGGVLSYIFVGTSPKQGGQPEFKLGQVGRRVHGVGFRVKELCGAEFQRSLRVTRREMRVGVVRIH